MEIKPSTSQTTIDFDYLAKRFGHEMEEGHDYNLFLEYLPNQRKAALDLGCGAGKLMQLLSPHFDLVVGIDLSYEMIKVAQISEKDNLRWIVADVARVPFPSLSFDYVVSHTCLHHVPDLNQALKEVHRLMRPGGRAALLDCVQFLPWPANRHFYLRYKARKLITWVQEVFARKATHIKSYRDDPIWLQHISRDQFLPVWKFASIYRAVLPRALIRRSGKFLMAIWDKLS